jgi:hypothetical protein
VADLPSAAHRRPHPQKPHAADQRAPRHPASPELLRPTNSLSTPSPTSNNARTPVHISIELPTGFTDTAFPAPAGPFGRAAKEIGDGVEVADSIEKWRELGPKGEALMRAAVEAKGWEVIDTHVYVRTSFGLRVEDLLARIPAGALGNPLPFDGFIEVKVNGGRYSHLQQAKDALIFKEGGTLLHDIPGHKAGDRIKLGTGWANITITYVRMQTA